MTRFVHFLLIAVISSLFSYECLAHSSPPPSGSPTRSVKAAYYPSWLPLTAFSPSQIDTSLFTHIYYAFVVPNKNTFKLHISPSYHPLLQYSNFTKTLRRKNGSIKTLLSVGGGTENATKAFSRIVRLPSRRKIFIDSAIEVSRKLGFDGIDVDWESPVSKKEMKRFDNLIHELRKAVDAEAKATRRDRLLLTAAVYYSAEILYPTRSYPVRSINRNLDWINAMCYDYHGKWENITGSHSALFDPKSNLSTSFGLKSWTQAGLNRKKIVMGLPLYGRSWKLKYHKINTVGSPAIGLGPRSDRDDDSLNYAHVLKFNKKHNATVFYDRATQSRYSVAGKAWIGYDDDFTTAIKIRYAFNNGYRGYFLFALGFDKKWQIAKTASNNWRATE